MIFKKSYIQIENLYGCKLVRAAKQSELKDAASSTEGIARSSVNYLREEKKKKKKTRILARSVT